MPDVMSAPIRLDVVKFVHNNMDRNKMQPKGVNQ